MSDQQPAMPNDVEIAMQFKHEFFWKAFKALSFNRISGDYVEFGSHGAMTFRLAADQIASRRIQRHMWAVDSFQGLPPAEGEKDEHPIWQAGTMSTELQQFYQICDQHNIDRSRYSVIEGFYDQSLTNPAGNFPQDIALAYVDCDLYSSTKTVLDFLKPRLKHGMVIAFDDYFCWSDSQLAGERAAFLELVNEEKQWNFLRYLDYGWGGTSYLVERADLLP